VGIPVLQVGNVITGSNVIAQIIDSCSGLRSMQILTFAAIFYVSWFPARRLRQVLLVILAPAIAYLFNLVRVSMIAVAPTSEFSTAHTVQGLMIFFGAIACLIVADRILGCFLPGGPKNELASRQPEAERRLQPEAEREPRAEAEPEGATPVQGFASSKGRLGAASLAARAVAMLGSSIWMPSWTGLKSDLSTPAELPAELDGWAKTQQVEIDRLFLWTVSFPRHEYWTYERNGDRVSVFVGYDDRSRRNKSLLSRKNALPRRGWEVLERRSVSLESVEAGVERVVARSQSAQILTYHWYEGTDGWASEILRALLAADQSPFRRSRPARVIRVATGLGSTPLAGMEDEERLRAFASSLVAALRE
jgi:EpsI family protein